jgi:hypothetical protein
VEEISLDHDLAPYGQSGNERTGFDVLAWLDGQIHDDLWEWPVPKIHIHTRNPVGWKTMVEVRERIRRGVPEH